jgi:hypothetical protein
MKSVNNLLDEYRGLTAISLRFKLHDVRPLVPELHIARATVWLFSSMSSN